MLRPDWLIADTAYGSGPMLGWLVDREIAPFIPVIDKSGRTDGTWSREDFEWDAENNRYICPEGQWAEHKVSSQSFHVVGGLDTEEGGEGLGGTPRTSPIFQ